MTQGDQLIQMICADPGDDDLRLAYAVWLADDADPPDPARSEFIRVQLETAVLESKSGGQHGPEGHAECPGCVRVRALHKQERALLDPVRKTLRTLLPTPKIRAHGGDHYMEWAMCLGRHFDEFVQDDYVLGLDRGMVERVACPAAVWLDAADRLYWHPEQRIKCPEPRDPKLGVWHEKDGMIAYSEKLSHKDCTACSGAFIIERPFVPSAQPITKVTLTTPPGDEFGLRHASHDGTAETGWVSDRWKGIVFLLTAEAYGPP